MAFPLIQVLTAAPGLISAAADVVRVIRERNSPEAEQQGPTEEERLKDMARLLEKQALVIEELAVNNRQLTLAVRNNRIVSVVSLVLALLAIVLSL